jgi:hypothetical protein
MVGGQKTDEGGTEVKHVECRHADGDKKSKDNR